MPNVVFDEASAARIAKAVQYVEGLQNPEETGEEEVVEQEPRRILRGSFAGTWRSGTSKTVSFVADNGAAGTKTATNYGPDVGGGGCVIVLAGGVWLLVWAGLAEYDADVSSVEATAGVQAVTDVSASGSITYLTSAEASSGATTDVEVVTSLYDTGREVVTDIAATGSNPYVQHINSVGSKTFVSDVQLSGDIVTDVSASGEVVTSVACVDGEIVVTTASLASLISVSKGSSGNALSVTTDSVSFSDLAEAQSDFLELDSIATVTKETLIASDLGSYSVENISVPNLSLATTEATLTLSDLADVTTATLTLEDLAAVNTTSISYYGPL